MASSKRPTRSKRTRSEGRAHLVAHVAAKLKGVVLPGQRLAVGLSGGIDSIVLLDVLARLAPRMRFALRVLHVNHQLSPNAAAWAKFCRATCRERGVTCSVATVEVRRGNSIESAAREARYSAFAATRADCIALAHNLDDQAETILLQLLRGAGVKGLSGMPFIRPLIPHPSSLIPHPSALIPHPSSLRPHPSIVRPLLDITRAEIEAYARRRRLTWIEDESNIETHFTRNWLRREVLPLIANRVPAYRDALLRAARNVSEAGRLLEELADIDSTAARAQTGFRLDGLRALSPARVKNLLRTAIDRRGWRMPESTRLDEVVRQLLTAKEGARIAMNLGSCEARLHRGVVHLLPLHSRAPVNGIVNWNGEAEIALPSGVLTMTRCQGEGMSVRKLAASAVTIRMRKGGERLQPDPRRPRRTVKNLLQESGIPPWQRERLPFIYCGDALACVPGLGIDCRFRAEHGEASVAPSWRES